MENVKISIELELTQRQYELLMPWENMNEWLKTNAEAEIFKMLMKMTNQLPSQE